MKKNLRFIGVQSAYTKLVCLVFLATACSSLGQRHAARELPVVQEFQAETINLPELRNRGYVVLVSIDGYRHDFNALYRPTNLSAIASEGVVADSMKPVYPSKTIPNHVSMATGVYPDRHGIVANEFYDPKTQKTFAASQPIHKEPQWYLAEPVWNTIMRQGLRTASFFWFGTDSEMAGMHPNYYFEYDEKVANSARVDQALAWLELPEDKRPHFITLYFNDVDAAAHAVGTNHPKVAAAVAEVDAQVGRLRDGIRKSGLPVNLLIVSDHGMADIDAQKIIWLDQDSQMNEPLSHFLSYGRGPQMQFYLKPDVKAKDRVRFIAKLKTELRSLAKREGNHFKVYARQEMRELHYSENARAGDLIVVPELPWLVGLKAQPPVMAGGNHGWVPNEKLMHGVFLAEGPGFKPKTHLATFENVNIQPLVLALLGLKDLGRKVDGRIEVTEKALRR